MYTSVYLTNRSGSALQLLDVRPIGSHNIVVEEREIVPEHPSGHPQAASIAGALRWPRHGDLIEEFSVLDEARPVRGFVLPAHSSGAWLATLRVRQVDARRSIRAAGVEITYTADKLVHRTSIMVGLCFTTPADTAICNMK